LVVEGKRKGFKILKKKKHSNFGYYKNSKKWLGSSIYKGSLLVLFVLLRAPKPQHDHGKSFHALGAIGKLLMNRGASSWFHNLSTYD
jgi:hypothetical protein